MQTLGFDTYVEPLKLYLQKYREVRESELYRLKKVPIQCMFHFFSQVFDKLDNDQIEWAAMM